MLLSSKLLSKRVLSIKSSIIREILKTAQQPQIISFAGGLPSPDTFPVSKIKQSLNMIMDNDEKFKALQYGETEGFKLLRQCIIDRINSRESLELTTDNILIVTGSQQALDLIGKALIDKGTKILVETPTYLGALQAFNQYEAEYISIPSDDQGLDPDKLSNDDAKLANFLYIIPNFQNPTGVRLSKERRIKLINKSINNDLLIIEDDPYGDLDYKGERLPSLIHYAPEQVIYLGSFSKILSPGMRLGYIIGPTELIKELVKVKQASDLHTPSITQHIAYHVIKDGYLETHIPKIRQLYNHRCKFMLKQLEKYMPKDVHWTSPNGGMFIWVELPECIDSTELLIKAIENNVAFVPGESFFATKCKKNFIRLAFVTVTEERIKIGIKILANLIDNEIKKLQQSL